MRSRESMVAFVTLSAAAVAAVGGLRRSGAASARGRKLGGACGLSSMVRRVEINGMEVLEVAPAGGPGAATASLVFLHGLGDTAHGWCEMFEQLSLKRTRVVLPTARSIPISVNGGMRMPGWMDIYDFPVSDASTLREDENGLVESVGVVRRLVRREIDTYGITPDRMFVGGFSQGGAVALAFALERDQEIAPAALAGVIALSTWLPLHSSYAGAEKEKVSLSRDTKMFWGHGTDDMVVPHAFGRRSADILESELGFSKLSFNSFPGVGHGADPRELQQVREFLDE